jgi:hypothetical protein
MSLQEDIKYNVMYHVGLWPATVYRSYDVFNEHFVGSTVNDLFSDVVTVSIPYIAEWVDPEADPPPDPSLKAELSYVVFNKISAALTTKFAAMLAQVPSGKEWFADFDIVNVTENTADGVYTASAQVKLSYVETEVTVTATPAP